MTIQTNLFQSATVRLTIVYVAILALICLFFSYNWYQVATAELRANVGRQDRFIVKNPRFFDNQEIPEFIRERERFIKESIENIQARIFLSNLFILGLGAYGSYMLAKRTLQPIEETHEAQKQFTADASHELRTPLAAMQTEIEVALRDKKLTKKEATDLLSSNLEELHKMTSLSENLLSLARQDSNGEEIQLEPIKFKTVLDRALIKLTPLAEKKAITIKTKPTTHTVLADSGKLEELLVILIDNAIKYSDEKSVVRVEARRQPTGTLQVAVIDTGIGIETKDQERIFERFFRVDGSRSKQKTNGHGLGLSIAEKTVKGHGSKLQIKSKPGAGSTFSFRLKLA